MTKTVQWRASPYARVGPAATVWPHRQAPCDTAPGPPRPGRAARYGEAPWGPPSRPCGWRTRRNCTPPSSRCWPAAAWCRPRTGRGHGVPPQEAQHGRARPRAGVLPAPGTHLPAVVRRRRYGPADHRLHRPAPADPHGAHALARRGGPQPHGRPGARGGHRSPAAATPHARPADAAGPQVRAIAFGSPFPADPANGSTPPAYPTPVPPLAPTAPGPPPPVPPPPVTWPAASPRGGNSGAPPADPDTPAAGNLTARAAPPVTPVPVGNPPPWRPSGQGNVTPRGGSGTGVRR